MSPPATTSAFVERVAAPRQPSAGKPPLLVLLHGIGADENDLLPIAGTLDPRLRVVSLRAPRPYAVGNAWFQIDFRPDGTLVPDLVQASDARRPREVARGRAGPPRHRPGHTYLLGFSQGAMMSLGLLQSVPRRLAGVIALSGRDPTGLFEVTADRIDIAQGAAARRARDPRRPPSGRERPRDPRPVPGLVARLHLPRVPGGARRERRGDRPRRRLARAPPRPARG